MLKNISTRELVLQRKLEKKRLEEEQYKKELSNIHNSYREEVKNSKKVYDQKNGSDFGGVHNTGAIIPFQPFLFLPPLSEPRGGGGE